MSLAPFDDTDPIPPPDIVDPDSPWSFSSHPLGDILPPDHRWMQSNPHDHQNNGSPFWPDKIFGDQQEGYLGNQLAPRDGGSTTSNQNFFNEQHSYAAAGVGGDQDFLGGEQYGPRSSVDPGIIQVTDVGVDAVMTAIIFNFILFILIMGTYELLRRILPSVYASRKHHVGDDRVAVQLPPSLLPLGWVGPVARVSWNQVRKAGGVDAYMFLRYLNLCLQITLVSGIWGMVILFPIFATGGGNAVGWYHLSMRNILQGSWRLWFPAIFMWYLTFYVLFLMNEEYKHFMEVRRDYLATSRDADVHPQHQYSLMVENVPNGLRSDKALFDYFNSLFPDKVHSACVVMNIPDLEEAARRCARVCRRLEKSFAIHEATGKRPTHVVGRKRCTCCGIESLPIIPFGGRERDDNYNGTSMPQRGERVDSINYYQRDLEDMNEKVERMQNDKKKLAQTGNEMICASEWIAQTFEAATAAAASRMESSREDGLIIGFQRSSMDIISVCQAGFSFFFGGFMFFNRHFDAVVESVVGNDMSSTGFVTFKDRFSATCARSAPLCPQPDILTVSMAPEPRDIEWDNAQINSMIIAGREATVNLMLIIGVLLWSVPVAFIQAMATVDSIAAIPGMEWVLKFDGGKFANFVNGYLPVIALLGLIQLLPIIFDFIATSYENRKTKSDVQNSMLGRFFYYQLANIYVTVTAGSLWDSLADIINHPSNVLWIFGRSLPTVVGYFIALLITKILAGLPIVLIRPGALMRMLFIKICFRERTMTQSELDEVYKKQMLWYGWEYPTQLLVIVICFTYSSISPIILPVGALYFLVALIVYKKQVLVVYTPMFEGGGKMFPSVCHRTLIGLICGQITLAGYILIRAGYTQVLFLLPLPFFTFRMINVFKKMYARPSEGLNLEFSAELDRAGTTGDIFDENLYRQPVLAEKRAEPQPYRRSANSPTASVASVKRTEEPVSLVDPDEEDGSGKLM